MGRHSGRRARIAFTDSAIDQSNKLGRQEIHALDRALAALSVDPSMGGPIPGSTPSSTATTTASTRSPSSTT